MVKDFIEMEREAGNMMIVWIVVCVATVVMLFVSGGGMTEHDATNVHILSYEGFIKINSILFFLALTTMIFIPEFLFVIDSILARIHRRTS
jgi:hypothetical protein